MCLYVWQETSCCVGLHPLVCSLIAEPHPLHEVIGCVRTPTEDTTEKKPRDTELKKGQHAFFPTLSLSSNSNMLPSIYVRNGVLLLCLYLVQEGGEDPPGLSQLIAGTGRRGIFSSKNLTWNRTCGSTRKCFSAYYNQPTCGRNASGSRRRHPGSAFHRHLGASHSRGRLRL